MCGKSPMTSAAFRCVSSQQLMSCGVCSYWCVVHMLSGDIITGDSDEPDVAGDHGPWNTRLGRGFLQPGNVSSQTVVVNIVYHAHLHTHTYGLLVFPLFLPLHPFSLTSYHVFNLGTCKVWDSIRIRIGRFRFDLKVTGWFEIFESAAPAVVPQTPLTVQQTTSTVAPL